MSAAWVVLRFDPGLLFGDAHAGTYVTVHGESALPATDTAALIERTEALVQRSPLFAPERHHEVYLCTSAWRWQLLTGGNSGAAGVSFAPFGRGVVLRGANLAHNRALQASGHEAPGERTLAMYVAHEVTHEITEQYVGALANRALPAWVREGYADYVGRGADYDYDDARSALLGTARLRAVPQTGAYLTYTLLVAHLLEREHWTVAGLVHAPPKREEVEARVRAGITTLRRD